MGVRQEHGGENHGPALRSRGQRRRDAQGSTLMLGEDGRDGVSGIDRLIASARELLDMDVAFVSEFADGRQVFRAAAGETETFGIELGTGPVLGETMCRRVVAGELPSVVPDVAADERASRVKATRDMEIGAYVGVPLFRSDGSLFGTFCCLSHEADRSLRERDARYLAMIGQVLAERFELEAERGRSISHIRAVIDDPSELRIALQPILNLGEDRITAVEALARFPGRTGSPASLFADAASVGLGVELETAVISRALTVIPELAEEWRLALNVSPDVLVHDSFTATLAAAKAPLGRLIIELTEHAAIRDYDEVLEVLAPLRARGLSVAVDDAGAGFASFAHVLKLRPDIVKIDRSLLLGLETSDLAARALFTALVDMARAIGASVTAEGAETAEQLALLHATGVSDVQGFLLGRPTTDRATWQTWRDSAPTPPASAEGRRRS